MGTDCVLDGFNILIKAVAEGGDQVLILIDPLVQFVSIVSVHHIAETLGTIMNFVDNGVKFSNLWHNQFESLVTRSIRIGGKEIA